LSGLLSCAEEQDVPEAGTPSVATEDQRTQTTAAPLFYDHPYGYCEDTDPSGVPWAPERPVWSDLAGPHYDGIVHSNGAQSIRYPNYRNVSHNLALLESLQFLLSMVTNVTNKVEDAQTMLQEGTYIDAAYGLLPQVDGHCVCINGSCNPATVLDEAEAVVTELLDVHNIESVLQDYIDQKVDATIADLQDLLDYFEDAVQPSGSIVTTLEQAIQQAIDQEIQTAISQMTGVSAPECTSSAFAQPTDYADAIESAVAAAVAELEAELQADVQTIQDAVALAIGTPTAVLNQLQQDLVTIQGFFAGVESFDDLIQLDWPLLVQTLQDMVPFYQDTVEEIQAAMDDVTGVWENITALDDRIEELADQIYADVIANIAATNPQMADCIAALQNASSFNPGAYDPSSFADNLTAALEGAIDTIWQDMKDRVEATWQSIQDRITGIGLEDGVAIFNAWTADAQAAITSTVEACYMRGPRPECFEHCNATDQDGFLWLPVDYLQDPAAFAAGTASGALFALEQTGWLDDFRDWVATQMESDLGAAFTSVLGFLADFQRTIEKILEVLGDVFDYIDYYSEGYHLGAYSDLRPDLHMCIGYYGHGAYAQMGGLGGNRISIGARYSSHNLSRRSRVQFRSGGFAVSAFSHELSILPGIELDWQMDGWKLWDQTRPFGIPMNIPINPENVAKYDVFNVVPMDRYPFGFTPDEPIQDQTFPAGSFLVRDLFPSGPTFNAVPQWPRPGVTDPWEVRSIAVMSLGLNLQFDFPADGPEYIELATIPIIPGILTVTPVFGFQLGAQWEHQVDLLRDRVLEKVNQNLPSNMQIDEDDFSRNMHAMQGPDLTADNRTSVYVEPSLGIEAFLGFKIWKIRVGAGALITLGINIRPAGGGGILDMNAALADALTNSNPPVDAPCEPVWEWTNTYSCNNEAFPESEGDYSCSPSESANSCCMQLTIRNASGAQRYSMCVDDWTGMTQEYCDYLDLPNAKLEDAQAIIEGLPGFLSNIKTRLLGLIETAQLVTIDGTWRAGASCAERECGGAEFEEVFSTAFLNVQSLSECEQMGFCTYEDETIVHDVSIDRCESGARTWQAVSTGNANSCAIDTEGALACWGAGAATATLPTATLSRVSVDTNYACGIVAATGQATCWRFNSSFDLGQTNAPAGTFRELAAGSTHTCAIRTDGTLACWGGWASQPDAGRRIPGGVWERIESGYNRSCAINSSREMLCFGEGVVPEQVLGSAPVVDVSMSNFTGVCALRTTGAIECTNMNTTGFAGSECTTALWGTIPTGPFTQITDGVNCGGCALRADGTTACWGGAAATTPLGISAVLIEGNSHNGPVLCGIDAEGTLACSGRAATGMPADGPTGIWTPYTCRTSTEGEISEWTGSGCHPLQHGWSSACGCSSDTDCASGETCEEGVCAAGGDELSCGCEDTSDCSAGRICNQGACAIQCGTTSDCPGGLECVSGACVPQYGIPFAETITWGMANVENPIHLISSFALSEIYATLKLTVNLYVELGFKLFGKERKWRILNFNRGYDLGSTWKGWYQPGLEARYQDECANPDLLEPVTNRFPRSLTSNPYDNAFNAPGVSPSGFCNNGGVCRYRDPLPGSQTDPGDYTLGNVGTVNDFLEYCYEDYPENQENPDHSTNEQIVSSVVDTYTFGQDVTLTVWDTNQVCVDGMVWDEWIAGLEPTTLADGTITDPGALAGYNCMYTDPTTGTVSTFPCSDINAEMMSIWGCLDTTANPFALILANAFPALVINDPVHGPILNVDAMFNPTTTNDPNFGLGEVVDYELANMLPVYRNYFSTAPLVSQVGAKWLQRLDACFSARFDSPAETACECATNADCDSEYGQFCQSGVCMDSTENEAGNVEVTQAFCPIVQLVAEVGQCCGDGVVQDTAGYTEECDDGPEGSATCSPQCTLLDTTPAGACCAGDGVCYENLNREGCAAEGGSFFDATTCDELNYCEDDGTVDPTPLGACCTETTCLDNISRERCAVIGTWTLGATCEELDYCEDTITVYGACCTDDGCFENVTAERCEGRGTFNANATCAEVNFCEPVVPVGGCCLPDGTCADGLDERSCAAFGGSFSAGGICGVTIECREPTEGACCTADGCLDAVSERVCLRRRGIWNGGESCAAINYCREEVPTGACCVDAACIEAANAAECERAGGSFNEGSTCVEIDYCREEEIIGACCANGGCYGDLNLEKCDELDGTFTAGATCEELNFCREVEPIGACCNGRECLDGVTSPVCERFGGRWSEGATCAEIDCATGEPPVGACCVAGNLCVDALTEAQCTERGGTLWEEGTDCVDCACNTGNDSDVDVSVEPPKGCSTTGNSSAPIAGSALVVLGLLALRRRRSLNIAA
jgi:MYXO-CTERM domain-containing protein